VASRIASLFDITVVFKMDNNGGENIGACSYFQGETPRSLRDKVTQIAGFSELREFLTMPFLIRAA